jgi:hypothetical protein
MAPGVLVVSGRNGDVRRLPTLDSGNLVTVDEDSVFPEPVANPGGAPNANDRHAWSIGTSGSALE